MCMTALACVSYEAWESAYHPRSSTTTEVSEHHPETPRVMIVPRELPNTGTCEEG